MLPHGHPGPIVSAQWLNGHVNDTDIIIVDATVHLPDTGRDAAAEYWAAVLPLEEAHGVPGSYSAHSRVEEGK